MGCRFSASKRRKGSSKKKKKTQKTAVAEKNRRGRQIHRDLSNPDAVCEIEKNYIGELQFVIYNNIKVFFFSAPVLSDPIRPTHLSHLILKILYNTKISEIKAFPRLMLSKENPFLGGRVSWDAMSVKLRS